MSPGGGQIRLYSLHTNTHLCFHQRNHWRWKSVVGGFGFFPLFPLLKVKPIVGGYSGGVSRRGTYQAILLTHQHTPLFSSKKSKLPEMTLKSSQILQIYFCK